MATFEERLAKRRAELAATGGAFSERLARRRAELADPRNAAIEAAKAGTLEVPPEALARAADADQIAEDEMTLAREGAVYPRLVAGVRGVPFVGEYFDEAADYLAEGGTERVRAAQGAMERQRPGQNLAMQVGTGIASAIPMAVAASPAITAAAPSALTGQVAAGIGAGATAGAIEGAVSGYGRGEGDERANEAARGGMYGGAFGGVAAGAAPAITRGVRNVVDWVKQSDIGVIAKELGVSKRAAKIIRRALDEDGSEAARATIKEAGEEAMLADGGPASQQLLDTAMSEGGAALRIGREAVDSRAAVTTPQLRKAFDSILGRPEGTKKAAREISEGSAKARQAAYNFAYRQPIDYASDKGRAIEAVLDRVPEDTLRAAVKEANDAMREAGERNMQILLDLDTGTLSEMPNVRQLDELKKALGTIAEKSKDQFGKIGAGEGVRASRLARDLKRALGDAVPVYKRAVKLGGDKIAEENALSLGRSVLGNKVSVEDVVDTMRDASKAEKTAFKRGLREAIEDEMSRAKAVLSDPNADAREAQAAFKALSSRKTRDKIKAAIGESATKRIESLMKKELPMLQTRSAVARGSQTAYRRAGQEAITEELTPGMAGEVARGRPINAGQRFLQIVNDVTPQADSRMRARVLEEVARGLTQKRGKAADAALAIIDQAMKGQPITEAQSNLIARSVGGYGPLAGYLTGMQAQGAQ